MRLFRPAAFRPKPSMRYTTCKSLNTSLHPHNSLRTLYTSPHRLAGPQESSGDYGSGAGDPKGSKPQEQGKSDTARKNEHPGPKSPAQSSSSSTSSAGSDGGGGGDPPVQGSGGGGESKEGGQRKKIREHDISQDADRVESEDVKKHNEEMKGRHDRATEQGGDVEEKVDKGYWSGESGFISPTALVVLGRLGVEGGGWRVKLEK